MCTDDTDGATHHETAVQYDKQTDGLWILLDEREFGPFDEYELRAITDLLNAHHAQEHSHPSADRPG